MRFFRSRRRALIVKDRPDHVHCDFLGFFAVEINKLREEGSSSIVAETVEEDCQFLLIGQGWRSGRFGTFASISANWLGSWSHPVVDSRWFVVAGRQMVFSVWKSGRWLSEEETCKNDDVVIMKRVFLLMFDNFCRINGEMWKFCVVSFLWLNRLSHFNLLTFSCCGYRDLALSVGITVQTIYSRFNW